MAYCIFIHLKITEVTPASEPAFFYFIFDPASVSFNFKTKLTKEELDEGGRCSHLKKFSEKFQIAECCITDLPERLRRSDFPKCALLQNNLTFIWKNDLFFRLQWPKIEWYIWIDINQWYSNFRQWGMERCFKWKQEYRRLGLWNEQASHSSLLFQGTFSHFSLIGISYFE